MQDAVIVSTVRTAVGKAPKGTLSVMRPDELGAMAIKGALDRIPQLEAAAIDDVIMGCAMPEGEQGMNVARISSLRAGIPVEASAVTINRFCSSGLQAIAYGAERIMLGQGRAAVGGGTESMSMVPMGGNKISPNPGLIASYPDVYLSTGLVAENHAVESMVTRAEQDAFALRSHQRALHAIEQGHFKNEIIPVTVRAVSPPKGGHHNGSVGSGFSRIEVREFIFDTDEGPRRDTSLEALTKLRPAFHATGTVTAGNSSQTSDGAAATIITSAELAKERGLTPLARFVGYATAGVAPELFGIGPVPAVRKVLKLTGLTIDQIDVIELNEAFAAQALACMKALDLDPDKVNVNGGAIALGHPLGCTGAKLTATIINELHRRKARYGLVTMCVGGGMGAAGIFERM
jgi:acetyl-CoA acyltransferase